MNKKNIALLALLILLVVVFMFSRKKENIEKRINFFKFTPENIHSFDILTSDDTLKIELVDSKWQISKPLIAPVKDNQINRFLNDFIKVETSNIPISESINRQTFYNVNDSTGTIINIYGQNQKLLQKVLYGKSNNYNYAYLRKYNDNKIYQINNLQSVITPSAKTWREDKILNIIESDINSISIVNNQDSFELIQNELYWNLSYADSVQTIENSNKTFSTFKNSLLNLRSSNFVDNQYDEYKDKFDQTTHEIIINLKNEDKIQLKAISLSDTEYLLMRNNEQHTLYKLNKYQFEQLFITPDKL
ncbi:MAG: DUF4340 domain-containing protein [Candidatus Cloacimonetes bacterium]|nr:DUF4340 domain-containing protein [Candidatus Cloacimonadota bacterium]